MEEWIVGNDEETQINDEEMINRPTTEEIADEDQVPVSVGHRKRNCRKPAPSLTLGKYCNRVCQPTLYFYVFSTFHDP